MREVVMGARKLEILEEVKEPEFKDGDDGGGGPEQITITPVKNGWILCIYDEEGDEQEVFSYDGEGPIELLASLMELLDIDPKFQITEKK